jgi:hypothetical protein
MHYTLKLNGKIVDNISMIYPEKTIRVLFIIFFVSVFSYAEDEETAYYQQHNEDVDQLAKLLEIPEVAKFQKDCEKNEPSNVSNCIWRKVNEKPQVLEAVQAKMDETLEDSDTGVSQYESVTAFATKRNQTKSLMALEKFYAEKISKELFGDTTSQGSKIKLLDHKKFNKIYENQLTKNILTAVSSFCIEAKMENNYPLLSHSKNGRMGQRKINVKNLSKAQETRSTTVNGTTQDITKSGAEFSSTDWQKCMDNVQYVCHGGEKISKNSDGSVSKSTAKKAFGVINKDCAGKDKDDTLCKDFAYTKGRACELTNYLKVAKQNLKAVEKISEGYKEIGKIKSYGVQGTDENMKSNTEDVVIDKKKLENITSVTSAEFVNEAGFAKEVSSDLANLEQCVVKDPDSASGYRIKDGAEEVCKQYLNTDHEERDKMINEHMLRQRSLAAKVEEMNKTGDNPEDLKKFLKDQGRTDKEIEEQLKNVDIKVLKEQITTRYANEKEELINSLNQKLAETSSEKSGSIDIREGSNDEIKLGKIHAELSAKTESYAQLIHYNNIVTGFLEIQDQDGNSKGRNTASIKKELENSLFNEAGLKAVGMDETQYENQLEGLGSAIENSDISLSDSSDSSSDSEEETSSTIGVDRINKDILNYDIEKTQQD